MCSDLCINSVSAILAPYFVAKAKRCFQNIEILIGKNTSLSAKTLSS